MPKTITGIDLCPCEMDILSNSQILRKNVKKTSFLMPKPIIGIDLCPCQMDFLSKSQILRKNLKKTGFPWINMETQHRFSIRVLHIFFFSLLSV